MTCPLCGESLSTDRPRYRITLEAADEARSSVTSGPDRYHAGNQVCEDCWKRLRDAISPE